MAKIVAFKDFHHESGAWATTPSPRSICAISGSDGYASVYFYVNIWIGLVLLDDGRLYFGYRDEGNCTIGTGNTSVIHGSTWRAWMYHSPHYFAFTSGDFPSGIRYFDMGTFQGQTGNIWLDVPGSAKANRVSVGADESTMSNWRYAGRLDPDHEDNFEYDDDGNLYYYLSIPVNNSGGNVNDTWAVSTQIKFEWPEIFDYFPWARYLNDSSHEEGFWSHNRKSPERGSLQRIENSAWVDCKNKMPENKADNKDTTFRYDLSWVKSPKLGKNK